MRIGSGGCGTTGPATIARERSRRRLNGLTFDDRVGRPPDPLRTRRPIAARPFPRVPRGRRYCLSAEADGTDACSRTCSHVADRPGEPAPAPGLSTFALGVVIALSADPPSSLCGPAAPLAPWRIVFAGRYGRRVGVLFRVPVPRRAVAPYSGIPPGPHHVVLFLVVVGAFRAPATRAAIAEAIAERSTRRSATRRSGGASAHRPRAARRRGPPRVGDRGPGRDRPADHPGHPRRGQARRLEAIGEDRPGLPHRAPPPARNAARRLAGRSPERAPQPGLDDTRPALVDAAREAGTTVRLYPDRDPVPLPAGSRSDRLPYRSGGSHQRRASHAPGADVDIELATRRTRLHL